MSLRNTDSLVRRVCRVKSRAARAILVSLSAVVVFGLATPLYAQSDGSARVRVVKPFISYDETFQWGDVPEIISEGADANKDGDALDYAWASDLFFEKQIWQLQFAYKNVRTIDVDYPTADGKLTTKRVWYMVYSVTNTGKQLKATLDKSVATNVSQTVVDENRNEKKFELPSNNLKGVYRGEEITYAKGDEEGAIEFVPRFLLGSASIQNRMQYERKEPGGLFFGLPGGLEEGLYYDAYDPIALAKIERVEGRKGIALLDTTQISRRKILPGDTVWGVATWADVDPRIDKFSVFVSGLTNALKWTVTDEIDPEMVGAGRSVERKVLKINFINPGDEAHSGQDIYNKLPGEHDYDWVFMR